MSSEQLSHKLNGFKSDSSGVPGSDFGRRSTFAQQELRVSELAPLISDSSMQTSSATEEAEHDVRPVTARRRKQSARKKTRKPAERSDSESRSQERSSLCELEPYTLENQMDVWHYPFVDHGTAYSAYYPSHPYPVTTQFCWSSGCRANPFSSALTGIQFPDSWCSQNARLHRSLYYPPRRSLGHVPVYIRDAGVPSQYAPAFAYQYTRNGVISRSSPPMLPCKVQDEDVEAATRSFPQSNPVETRISQKSRSPPRLSTVEQNFDDRLNVRQMGHHRLPHFDENRSSSAQASEMSSALVQALRADGHQLSQGLREMESVMTVQSHEIRMMVSAIRALRDQVQYQKAQLTRSEEENKELEATVLHLRKGGYGQSRTLDNILRKAERQLGAALFAGQQVGLPLNFLGDGQKSFFRLDGKQGPEITTATVAIGRTALPAAKPKIVDTRFRQKQDARVLSVSPTPSSDEKYDAAELDDDASSQSFRSSASSPSRERNKKGIKRAKKMCTIIKQKKKSDAAQPSKTSAKGEMVSYETGKEKSSISSTTEQTISRRSSVIQKPSRRGESMIPSSSSESSKPSSSRTPSSLSNGVAIPRLPRRSRSLRKERRSKRRGSPRRRHSTDAPRIGQPNWPPPNMLFPLPEALQEILDRPLAQEQGEEQKMIVVTAKPGQAPAVASLNIKDIRAVEFENKRLHQVVATLEKRVQALYAELRQHGEKVHKEKELLFQLQQMKQERDELRNRQQELQRTVDDLRRVVAFSEQQARRPAAIQPDEITKPSPQEAEEVLSVSSRFVSSSSSSSPRKPRRATSLDHDVTSLLKYGRGSIPRIVSSSSLSSSRSSTSSAKSGVGRDRPGQPLPAPAIITTLAEDSSVAPGVPAAGPARYTYTRVSRRRCSHSSSPSEGGKKPREKKERRREKKREKSKIRLATPIEDEAMKSVIVKIPSTGVQLTPRTRSLPTIVGPKEAISVGSSSVPSAKTERKLIELLRNQLEAEQKRADAIQKKFDHLRVQSERLRVEADLREDKLRTALQYQGTVKDAETENLRQRLESQEALVARLFSVKASTGSLGQQLKDTKSRSSSILEGTASREVLREELQRVMTQTDERIKTVLEETKQQAIAAQSVKEAAADRERSLREALLRSEQNIENERRRRHDVETQFTQFQSRQKQQLEREKQALLRAADEIKALREKVRRTQDRDVIAEQHKRALERRKELEQRITVLQERFREEQMRYQQRLEESQRTFEEIVAERDQLRIASQEMQRNLNVTRQELQATTRLLEQAEKTIIDLSPEERERYIDALAERARSTDQQVLMLQQQMALLKQQKQQSETIRIELQQNVEDAKRKLDALELSFQSTQVELERHTALLGEERMERLERERVHKETNLRNAFLERTLVEHEETIKQKDKKIQECLENREKFKDALTLMGDRYKGLERELETCESKLVAERAVVADLMQVAENLRKSQLTLESQLAAAEKARQELQDRVARADLVVIRRGAELKEVTKRLEAKVEALNSMKVSNDNLEKTLDHLRTQYDALNHETLLTQDRLDLSKSLQQLTSSRSQTISQQARQTTFELDRIETELDQVRQDLSRVTGERDRCLLRVKALDATVDEQAQEISTLQVMVNKLQHDLSARLTEFETLTHTKKNLLSELALAREKERAQEGYLKEFEARLQDTLKEKDEMIENLVNDIERCRKQILELQSLQAPAPKNAPSGMSQLIADPAEAALPQDQPPTVSLQGEDADRPSQQPANSATVQKSSQLVKPRNSSISNSGRQHPSRHFPPVSPSNGVKRVNVAEGYKKGVEETIVKAVVSELARLLPTARQDAQSAAARSEPTPKLAEEIGIEKKALPCSTSTLPIAADAVHPNRFSIRGRIRYRTSNQTLAGQNVCIMGPSSYCPEPTGIAITDNYCCCTRCPLLEEMPSTDSHSDEDEPFCLEHSGFTVHQKNCFPTHNSCSTFRCPSHSPHP